VRPCLTLGRITEQVHDDGPLGDGLVHLEEVLSRHPPILDGVFPRLAVFAHADDDIETVVAEVEALSVALRAVANKGKSVVLEVILLFCRVSRLLSDDCNKWDVS